MVFVCVTFKQKNTHDFFFCSSTTSRTNIIEARDRGERR